MDLQKYLARIGYTGPVTPDFPTLRALHLAHILAVPFENLDIHAGRKITVGAENAYRKIVGERRGGSLSPDLARIRLYQSPVHKPGFAGRPHHSDRHPVYRDPARPADRIQPG